MIKYFCFLCFTLFFAYSSSSLALVSKKPVGSSIKKTLIYYGGGKKLKAGDEVVLAKYDMLLIDRYRYYEINKDTWSAIRKINPFIQILLYQVGPEAAGTQDDYKVAYLNNIGRFKKSKQHSMGSISEHPDFFLKNKYNNHVKVAKGNEYFLLDFGNEKYQNYWIEATISDLVERPWSADGINVDVCVTYSKSFIKSVMGLSTDKYKTASEWDSSMNNYINSITQGMHKVGQKVLVNRGNTKTQSGYNAWLDLDRVEFPPDVVFEEGAFAVNWGRGAVQFFSETEWLRQVELPKKIKKSDILYLSHTDLDVGEEGHDSWLNKVDFKQILHYSIGSYLLAKPINADNLYFAFDAARTIGEYRHIWWFKEYENLNFGHPVTAVKKTVFSGINIYWREYNGGFVYVNPTYKDANMSCTNAGTEIKLLNAFSNGEACKDGHIKIKAHHAFFFKKHT